LIAETLQTCYRVFEEDLSSQPVKMVYEIIKILGLVLIGFAVLVALIKWGIVIVYIISGLKKGFDGDTEILDESDGD
jgi:hypothetical protein